MAIDTSGKWWVGDSPQDIEAYLRAYVEDPYRVDRYRLSKCGCGSVQFIFRADRNEGCARVDCTSCGSKRLLLDSADIWAEARPRKWRCIECKSETCNVGVGLSLYEEQPGDVRWAYVGNRCAGCGVLGSYVDWKVGYGPADALLTNV